MVTSPKQTIGTRPIHILQVLFDLNRGGSETWLMHVLRHADPDRFRMDFLLHTEEKGAYEEEVIQRGCKIFRCPRPVKFWSYGRAFRRILRENGPYDVLHSHVTYQGIVARLAYKENVPTRIMHSHNDRVAFLGAGWLRPLIISWTNRWVHRYATHGLACSERAATALFGEKWRSDPRWQILYCGIDVTPFEQTYSKEQVRTELGIPANALVIGHIGRFHVQKNHAFLLEIAAALVRKDPSARVILVGGGELENQIRSAVIERGLADHVCLLGVRPDVPRILKAVVDVAVLPSRYEGLPLVALEAQAAGVPIVVSSNITSELDFCPELVARLSLDDSADVWATEILDQKRKKRHATPASFRASPFTTEASARALEELYLNPFLK
ncbi:MAG: glycosyltransferase family 1 protein [Gemmataceae bacterium]